MSTTPTTHFAFGKPANGGDSGSWGTELNAALDAIDAALFTVQTTANEALPLTGGALTGRVDVKTSTMVYVDRGSVTGAIQLDVSNAQFFGLNPVAGNLTLTVINTPAGCSFLGLLLVNGGSHVITWMPGVKWPNGTPPVLSTTGIDVLSFVSTDGGTTWRLMGVQLNLS